MTCIKCASVDDVAKGATLAVEVDGTRVALVHAEDDQFYAVYDECSHAAVALSEGEVDGCTLECWLHGSRFDLRTGSRPACPPPNPSRLSRRSSRRRHLRRSTPKME
jgi:3-phenylpropionate/trans-cinnamate dioxygenase ferredoxin subunit